MDKETKQRAHSKGATTEMDFALFANLQNLRKQFKKQLGQMKMTTGIPPPRGILLRYDFFLERGRFFEAQPLPKGYRRGRAKDCYSNSFKLAISKEALIYCEGFVVIQLGKDNATDIEHGWCVAKDGKVIDVTLGKPGLSYFGVAYALEELVEIDSVPHIDKIIEAQLNVEMRK